MTISKKSINKRFSESATALLDRTPGLSKKALAEILNIGATNLSEILNDRMGVSTELIAKFCLHYNIDMNWMLTGETTDQKREYPEVDNKGVNVNDPESLHYTSGDANSQSKLLELMTEENKLLKKQLEVLQTVLKEKQDIIEAFKNGSIIVSNDSSSAK